MQCQLDVEEQEDLLEEGEEEIVDDDMMEDEEEEGADDDHDGDDQERGDGDGDLMEPDQVGFAWRQPLDCV